MLSELANAPLSAWIGIGLAGLMIAIGLTCILANEILRFMDDCEARDDAAYDRAHGDVVEIPSVFHPRGDTE